MSTWRLARSIEILENQLRVELPGVSLGDIGDAAHQAKGSDSDHNPWVHDAAGVGVVRAVDVMTTNGDTLAKNLAAKLGKHPAMKHGAYVIWNRRIISADRRSEGWRAYDGANPHTDHVHVSVALDQRNYDSTAEWGSLTKGSGATGGTTPAPPVTPPAGSTGGAPGDWSTSASDGHAYHNGTGGGVQAAGFVPGGDQIKRMALTGTVIFGAIALIAVGLDRITQPAREQIAGTTTEAASLAIPELRAATAAGAATKGVPA